MRIYEPVSMVLYTCEIMPMIPRSKVHKSVESLAVFMLIN